MRGCVIPEGPASKLPPFGQLERLFFQDSHFCDVVGLRRGSLRQHQVKVLPGIKRIYAPQPFAFRAGWGWFFRRTRLWKLVAKRSIVIGHEFRFHSLTVLVATMSNAI